MENGSCALTTHTEKKSDRVNVKKEKYLSSHRDFVCLQISELRKDVQNRHWTVSKHGWIPNTESFFSNLPITKYYLNLGEISSYPPGYKENAGIFCHNNPVWVISIAETRIRRGNRAFEIYKKTCPAYIEEISEIHRTEPYVYSQMIAGKDAPKHGEAKNSWLTGTAAWTFVNVSQYILGIRPEFEGLTIDPCIPSSLGEFTVTRKFRDAVYHIHICNPNHVESGIVQMTVNGVPYESNCITPQKDVREYQVEIVMG